ncbi:MAG: PorP/SprF family type IX secretion system membrane protein [Flavobacteriales bacterium]|nr:PorP/SprF family type IX secretion system membrane protein [Flavobacteriales bacterium]MCB9364214.1 PorP/SprF family type IX secretion system membrane protein [Flavobacteriales bacterium]
MKKLVAIFLSIFLCSFFKIEAQDMQFTQFNAAPLYLNPAFTGSTIQHRFASSYRNQWTAIPGHYNNFAFSYDYNLADFNSGIGLVFAREQAGTAGLSTTETGLLYSYRFLLKKQVYIQAGLKFNYIRTGINFSKLVFNDQLYTDGSATTESLLLQNTSYLDLTSGVLIYSSKFWGGIAVNHMNQPNQSLTNNESPLYLKLSAHGGYKFDIDDGNKRSAAKYFNLAFQYKAQHKFDQLDLGIYYTQEPLVFGIWYRGIPLLKSYEGILNNDAVAVILGYVIPESNLSIGYSYDATISKLLTNTAGSHEISIIYEVASKRKKKRGRKFFAPCAKF